MAKNKFKRIRKLASVAEHNRKYGLQQAEDSTPEAQLQKLNELSGALRFLPPELPEKPATPSLGQLFSWTK